MARERRSTDVTEVTEVVEASSKSWTLRAQVVFNLVMDDLDFIPFCFANT